MLKTIAEGIRKNKNIIEKKEIKPIVQFINSNSYKSSRIFTDIGEDSATIENSDKYILCTTDRIKTSYIENYPFGAGFSSILVGVDDIYACGGTPLAATIIISFKDIEICKKVIEGVIKGSNLFQVPIIRGHTSIRSKCYELSSTMIGEIKKENYLSAGNAKINDNIILVVDFEGKIAKANKMYWDTVTFKNSEEVLRKRKSMKIIAEKHLANTSKDISNGGIFGTILQLIRYSEVGANVNINKIKMPQLLIELNYSLEMFVQMYLTSSFILTAPENNCDSIIKVFNNQGLEASVIGKIIQNQVLKINEGKESIDIL